MEEDSLTEPPPESLKRPNSPTETVPSKKVRLGFSVKEFRKALKSEKQNQALQGFLRLINEDTKQGCILTYLEHGGSALEILQTMEGGAGVSPVLVFEIVNLILLQIGAKLPRQQNAAYDASRYLLNTYLPQINKMLGLSSSTKERLAALKLLTTIVTFSVVLAKDVLLQVNFNPTNVFLLTKVKEGNNDVREAFIYFITAFLVDGHFPTLSVLLEKRGLMTSIINGLQYDKVQIVVLVLTAMKNHILENGSVSKTVKMKTFSTPIVRDIVNLYNWRGPAGFLDHKNRTKTMDVHEIDKSKVNEAVHSFLLILCTSHKLGVIFKDPMVGLGRKQNPLMLTVLESLERPWEHSYAGELVVKICRACPDLAKPMWTNLKPFLEPRWTEKWLKSVEFAKRLLDEYQPDAIEFAANQLNVHQMTQVITILTSPLPILKALIPENRTFDQPAIKYHIMSLFLKMANSLEKFLRTYGNFDTSLSTALASHVHRYFPGIQLILTDWDQKDENVPISDYLDTALDLIEKYKILAPKMLEDCDVNFDMKEFLAKIEGALQVKAVKFFMDLEPGQFKPKTELFKNSVSFCLEFYHSSRDSGVFEVLTRLLQFSGVFDGFQSEIDFWIEGVSNVKNYDQNVAQFLCGLLEKADENASEYQKKLFQSKANFSTLVLTLSDHFSEVDSKSIQNYVNFVILSIFHTQFDPTVFVQVVSNCRFLSEKLRSYMASWANLEVAVLIKSKGKLMEQFHTFSKNFLENILEPLDFDFHLRLNFLQMMVFYLTNLIKAGSLSDNHTKNSLKFVHFLISEKSFADDRYVRAILGNPTLLENFDLFNPSDFSTKFILDIVQNLENSITENYLVDFRKKVVSTISKMLRKPEKYQNAVSTELLEIVALDYEHCNKLLTKFVNSLDNKNYLVACYCLNRVAQLAKNYNLEPLSGEIITKLSKFFVSLIETQLQNLHILSRAFYDYLRIFPHNIEDVEDELFDKLVSTSEFNKDNLLLCEFLLARKPSSSSNFEKNLDAICSKRSFILTLLDTVVQQNNDLLEKIFKTIEPHIIKALQKPHKAGQHFQNRYLSVGILIEKFMTPEGFGTQIQKFETTELFHVHLLKKVFDKVEKSDKIFGNMIMTFIHLLTGLLKHKSENLSEIGQIFCDFLREGPNLDVAFLSGNETFKMFYKMCLKYGLAGDFILVEILTELTQICVVEDDGKLILEMMLSHSQFLDVVLGDSQIELLSLWKALCTKWPQFMERSHVPVLLSAYKATKTDEIALSLLKMYESKPSQTNFFEFKPFLWGRAAASHYSVRSDIQKGLWRQPKMADVLNNLHLGTITATVNDPSSSHSYDLDFFLPLFSLLLSPENPVTTYRFTRSGAVALALTGFRGDKSQRLATCHILQRFYFHLEAKQSGDNLVWLRFIEAICKGVAVVDDFKINSFVGIFLARMALVLAQPTDVMYVPLTQYLGAKDSPDFSAIPELYTFLHSPHVDSRQHKHFVLEVLRDGLKSDKDFTTLLRSMGFKLISELCSSTVCDFQTKVLVLEVFEKCCGLKLGVKILCGSLSFLTQIFSLVLNNVHNGVVLSKLLNILLKIVEVDGDRHRNFLVYLNLMTLNEQNFRCLTDSKSLSVYYHVLMVIVARFPDFFTKDHMDAVLTKSQDKFCEYLVHFGCRFVKETDFVSDSDSRYLRLLFFNKLSAR